MKMLNIEHSCKQTKCSFMQLESAAMKDQDAKEKIDP